MEWYIPNDTTILTIFWWDLTIIAMYLTINNRDYNVDGYFMIYQQWWITINHQQYYGILMEINATGPVHLDALPLKRCSPTNHNYHIDLNLELGNGRWQVQPANCLNCFSWHVRVVNHIQLSCDESVRRLWSCHSDRCGRTQLGFVAACAFFVSRVGALPTVHHQAPLATHGVICGACSTTHHERAPRRLGGFSWCLVGTHHIRCRKSRIRCAEKLQASR